MGKRALITGITGQDGSYLAELLLEEGYEVFGLARRSATFDPWRIEHLVDRVELIWGDLGSSESLIRALRKCRPDEVYNLASHSYVGGSWDHPEVVFDINAVGVCRLLNALRTCGYSEARLFQASTSEMFGKASGTRQTEDTPFHPRSPYGVAKAAGHWYTVNFRESYDMFCLGGILFNHESPRRGQEFVTRKITRGVARIAIQTENGQPFEPIRLGNLNAARDWGHARDYMRAAWLMLQQDSPRDLLVATGTARTVREFADRAFEAAGIGVTWEGEGTKEVGRDDGGAPIVVVDEDYFRPADVEHLEGDATRSREILGWEPHYSFEDLVGQMVDADIARHRGTAMPERSPAIPT